MCLERSSKLTLALTKHRGGFSTVFVATHKETEEMYAVKHIKKYEEINENFTWQQEEQLVLREVETLGNVKGCSKG